MKEFLFQIKKWSIHRARYNGATATSICLLGQVGPDDPINSFTPLLYGHDSDDIDNRGFGFVFQEEKTHNRGSNLNPRSKFLDRLAISDSLFFLVLQ